MYCTLLAVCNLCTFSNKGVQAKCFGMLYFNFKSNCGAGRPSESHLLENVGTLGNTMAEFPNSGRCDVKYSTEMIICIIISSNFKSSKKRIRTQNNVVSLSAS